jgi:hypothetical protein
METGEALATILGVAADTGATVLFVIFMYLWHKRTMARDSMFNDTMQNMLKALMDCVKINRDN